MNNKCSDEQTAGDEGETAEQTTAASEEAAAAAAGEEATTAEGQGDEPQAPEAAEAEGAPARRCCHAHSHFGAATALAVCMIICMNSFNTASYTLLPRNCRVVCFVLSRAQLMRIY